MRKKIVAGNWKMNLTGEEYRALCKELNEISLFNALDVFVFPPMLYIADCLKKLSTIHVGAQNAYFEDKGAFTGEVSMMQLKSFGVSNVLIGHSERRMYFHENNQLLKQKVDAALKNQIQAFFCCGEPLEVRENGNYFAFVKQQLEESVFHLEAYQFKKLVLAYEPIWAIGTGKTATTEQAEEMHAEIRKWVAERYSQELANEISILYGGSCNPSNAKALFACPNVDGGLIGGASLKAEDFSVLVSKETWTI